MRPRKLATSIALEAIGNYALAFERIVRHRRVNCDTTQTYYIFHVNIACQSLRYALIVYPSSVAFSRQTEKTLAVFNPTKVYITLEGVPLKIYSHGMFPSHFFEEAYQSVIR